jgi:Protein of unknown function (DUF3093)
VSISGDAAARYRERLYVPVRWWGLLLLFLFGLWLAVVVSTPAPVMITVTVLATGLGAGVLVGYGAAQVAVDDRTLTAGRARLEWACCGPATALTVEETRRLHGVDADPRAYLLVRPYITTAVRVEVRDPADPTPYWMLSSRRPEVLADSINTARVLAD